MTNSPNTRSRVAIKDREQRSTLHLPWIMSTWGIAAGISIVATVLIVGIARLTGLELATSAASESVFIVVIGAAISFVAFMGVIARRLLLIDDHRLTNSLAVGALHIAFAVSIFLISTIVEATSGSAIGGDLGLVFYTLERSAVAALAAAVIANALVPMRGTPPHGTQRGYTDTEDLL